MKTPFLIPIAVAFGSMTVSVFAQTTVSYTSPITDYQPFVDEKITSWKGANDKVGQIGGWRAYAKEAQQPENTPPSSQNSVTLPKAMTPEPQTGQQK